MRAIVLAGGAGTRLRPLTDTRPKPMVPFCGEPFAAGLLRRLSAVASTVTFLTGREQAPAFDALAGVAGMLGVRVDVLAEPEPLDTAGAVRALLQADRPDEPVLVCNGDVLTDAELPGLVAAHRDAAAVATIALAEVDDPSAYGVVVTGAGGRVTDFVEKPEPGTAPASTVNAGTYVLDPAVFDRFPGVGPLSFEREVFPGLLADGATLSAHIDSGYWSDLGTPARYLDGTAAVLDGRCAWPLAPGLQRTVAGALLHPTAAVSGDAHLGPGSVAGARARVGRGARLEQAVLFDDARVGEGAVVRRAVVGAGARIAAGAEPPAETVVGDRGRWPPAA